MNLRSCENCGIVVDVDIVNFPDDMYDHNNEIDEKCVEWYDGEFVVFINCPLCKGKIRDIKE
jgi:hypothetical protein